MCFFKILYSTSLKWNTNRDFQLINIIQHVSKSATERNKWTSWSWIQISFLYLMSQVIYISWLSKSSSHVVQFLVCNHMILISISNTHTHTHTHTLTHTYVYTSNFIITLYVSFMAWNNYCKSSTFVHLCD